MFGSKWMFGKVTVAVEKPVGSGESVIMTSLFTAFVMLLAAFYY